MTKDAEHYLFEKGFSKSDQKEGYILKVEELIELLDEFEQLNIPVVMQAEGSDVSEGAAVGNSAAGQSVCGDLPAHYWIESLGEVFCKNCGQRYIRV